MGHKTLLNQPTLHSYTNNTLLHNVATEAKAG